MDSNNKALDVLCSAIYETLQLIVKFFIWLAVQISLIADVYNLKGETNEPEA